MKRIKILFYLAFAALLCAAVFAGCGKKDDAKPVILVVSFGTSYNDNRELSVGGIEKAIEKAYPDYEIRRAFTSQIIIDKLKQRDNITIDNVKEAMDRLLKDGVKSVVIQPTHVMNGYEYDDVIAEITPYRDKFTTFKVGKNLLSDDSDYDAVVTAITRETETYTKSDTAIVFMGHGTEHGANAVYGKLQEKLTAAGFYNYFIGTVEAEPTLEEVLEAVEISGAKKVVLLPFMIVAGDHANNDMADLEDDESWASVFTENGYEVECVLKGLGQYAAIQDLTVKHIGEIING